MLASTIEHLEDLRGFLPFRTRLHEREIDFVPSPSDLDFALPFFHITIEGLTASETDGELDTITLSFDDLRSLVGETQPAPTGMIFHIGRCGSTLVSRMVGHDAGQLVLRESAVIGGLHRASSGSEMIPTFTIEQAFKDALVAYEQFAAARDQNIIVKHSSWESFSMNRVAELLPSTRFVFVYRDPIATVESSLDGHPGWGPRLHEPHGLLARWVPWIERLTPPHTAAEVYASVWASGAEAALQLPIERVLLVDHRELIADPETTLTQLRTHLRLEFSTAEALGELGRYSKARKDDVAFDPAGSHARPPLSPRVRDRVLEIVDDLPERLEARLRAQAATVAAASELRESR